VNKWYVTIIHLNDKKVEYLNTRGGFSSKMITCLTSEVFAHPRFDVVIRKWNNKDHHLLSCNALLQFRVQDLQKNHVD